MISVAAEFELINNLDHRPALRKFAPQWAIVVVNSNLEIVGVHRFKTRPTVEQANVATDSYRNCVYFYTNPEMYGTPDVLKNRVVKCAEAFRVLSAGARKP